MGVSQAEIAAATGELSELEALPKLIKLAALHEDAAEPEAGRGERLGVGQQTAMRDDNTGVPNGTPSPTVVTGADGKVYPAHR